MRINSTGLLATNGKHFPLPATPREPPTPLSHGLVPSLIIYIYIYIYMYIYNASYTSLPWTRPWTRPVSLHLGTISVQSRHSAQLFEPMNAARALFLPLCGGTRGAAGLFLLGRLSGSGEIRARDTLPMGAGGNSTSSSLSLSLSLSRTICRHLHGASFIFFS